MDPDEAQEHGWKRMLKAYPDRQAWIEHNLFIATKRPGEILPLRLNYAQIQLLDAIAKLEAKQKPIRMLLLKARQLGMSTLLQALAFYMCSHRPGTFSLTIGNKGEVSLYLLNMSRRYLRNLWWAPEMSQKGRDSLVFGHDSRMTVETARAADEMGRSNTVHFLHCSEFAFWPYPEEGLLALLQVQGDYPGTYTFLETTANGRNYFWQMWVAATKGESDWIPVFFPWFTDPLYSRVLEPASLRKEFEDSLTLVEERLMQRHSLSLEQLSWRRWTIRNKCGGSVEKFQQEYPATPEEAFIHSVAPVFEPALIDRSLQKVRKPKIYEIRMET